MTKTQNSRRRIVRFSSEAERSINVDSSIEEVRHEEHALEETSPSISADSSEEMSIVSEASSLGVT